MKKILTLIMCVAFSATMFGQTAKVEERVKALEGDAKTLKGQAEALQGQIATMQSRLNELADRNAEYKKQFRKTGNVKVTLMALNLGQDAYPGILHGASFNDYDGNIYMCHEDSVSVGGLSNYEVLRHNINTKITMMFTGVPVNTRISNISSYRGGGATYFSLRDIKIDWR